MTSRMKRSQGKTAPAASEIMARLAAAASGNSQALAIFETLRFSMTGVIIERDLNRDEWLALIENTRRIRQAYRWMVGDLMVYGVKKSFQGAGDIYDEVAPLTGYTSDALKNIASVCRSVEFSRRRENLTFAHHEAVARLSPDEQAEWLDKAIDGKWKRDRLRQEIAKAQLPAQTVDADAIDWPDGVTVERVEWAENEDDSPALSDEIIDIADPIHEKRISSFRKKAAQNRLADIDLNDIIAEQDYLANLRKKVAAAKVEADRQARGRRK